MASSDLKRIAQTEKDNLSKLMRLEQKALFFTANQLSESIKTALNADSKTLSASVVDAYADMYSSSMMLAWLMGQYHVANMINVELSAPTPILLSNNNVSFTEAIEHLKAMVPMESSEYRQMEAAMKLRAFTIASVSGIDAINRVKSLYTEALESGVTRSQGKQSIDAFLERVGISEANPYYLELHYRNNMMTAYNAGRWTQVANNDLVEYLVYSSVMDAGTTELCRHLDNVIKPKSDPFWEQYYPPNHHQCRGTVSVMSRAQYNALPLSQRNHSMVIDDAAIKQDDVMAKEHQFKSSPVVSIQTIPKSMMDRAEQYNLTHSILKRAAKDSQQVLAARADAMQAQTLPKAVLAKAVKSEPELDVYSEMMTEKLLAQSDDVYFTFDELESGDSLPVLAFVLHLDDQLSAVAYAPAFEDIPAYKISAVTDTNKMFGSSVSIKPNSSS